MLVVDDEPDLCELFSRVLDLAGFTNISAHSGEAALSLLEQGLVPSAVLLDLVMPGMGGLEFLARLRSDARYASIPVTIVTGDCFINTARQTAVESLGAALTFKPLHNEEVLSVVVSMVEASL